ncbi:bifunctional tRNA (5-methylaminomethyl-2-thiouridine)(34)-methyltransferase MnmD/FAD-dependent 5-carboxymethylaminomethyl-2-thiouridine(34) oxidoreductase MnmC [Neptuniibacter caesariensis]|uniref:bifunctional tRNA (5-methylaminomethyl-2-thiouridine)(34)-methyltransferase MnmD/FAD-dependent 5-carboxymethylaminomethyl-2-thiouridine(34) oxidoreductase MnmC n=1 Tax=Neptuniibacter caesariensis TaxID=207954 RepID=UPI00058D499F|nr:bifunctional tRNA (5-methylaminomethyl-2-thiouridine)(34)-methyltransferase MnmD/FAD-dependent 5-carboxymethylaminomethyl-2-thiouridine(34) oxidoreductase MnmC [Neptuniibacter caesariensis]
MSSTTSASSIKWKSDTPFSSTFNDIYFSPTDGKEETDYVFIDGNKLPERIKFCSGTFTIAETGFGTGLNFLCSWLAFRNNSNSNAHLHFISVEKFPLSKADIAIALQKQEVLKGLSSQFIDQYNTLSSGINKFIFDHGKVRLTLIFDDASKGYQRLNEHVDAWYLDGFAPSKNPDMWSPELFQQIARLSHPGTTFSTFTAAGIVRRGLQEAGFEVSKQKGFGRKREMLIGTFTGKQKQKTIAKPWFELPRGDKPESVTIIGGGLSGCTTARALAERDIQVTLIEKEDQLATGGSGNRQGALYAKLPVKPTNQGELHLAGFLHTVNKLKQLDPEQTLWSQCGVAQLATNEKELKRQQELIEHGSYSDELVTAKSAEELSTLAGSRVEHSGLFFPDAGWVSPRDLCRSLVEHKNIQIQNTSITTTEYNNGQWVLTDNEGNALHASHLIICNAELANQFEQTSHIPLKPIRGQVSISPVSESSLHLDTVICGEGYISPAKDNLFCFGATFDLKGKERNVTDKDHAKNLHNLSQVLPEIHSAITGPDKPQLEGRTAFRCSTPDYMPIVGPVPVHDSFTETFGKLRKDRKWKFENVRAEHHPNLFINTGHGSKGLITCPISAELLTAMICDEPLPLPKDLVDTINPARFIIKNLIKQAI